MSFARGRRLLVVGRSNLDTIVVLTRDGAQLASWPLPYAGRPGLAVVDELLRLQLAARRRDCSIEVHCAGDELPGLLALVGLEDVVRSLRVEMVGQLEGGEQVGVEKAVQGGDPVARDLDDLDRPG